MTILLLTTNLLDSTRVDGTAQLLGMELLVVADADRLVNLGSSAQAALVLLDLDTPKLDIDQLVRQLRDLDRSPKTIIAFGPHVESAKLATARQAGCNKVLPRSEFYDRLPDILNEFGTIDD